MKRKRHRATVVLLREDGSVLLVRDHSARHFSLPGGGINRGEVPAAAAAREAYEELGVTCSNIRFECEHESRLTYHQVFSADWQDEPYLKSEISEIKWWDLSTPIRAFDSVREILTKIGRI